MPALRAILLALLCATAPAQADDDWLLNGLVDVLDDVGMGKSTYVPLSLPAGPANRRPAFPRVEARPMRTAPVMDGEIEDAWRAAGMTRLYGGKVPTWVYLGFDAENLYVAFYCREPAMDIPVPRDNIWEAESVQLFLDVRRDRANYYHFGVFPWGAPFARKCFGLKDTKLWGKAVGSWNPKWQAAVGRGPTHWAAEMKIPLASLEPGLNAGYEWGIELVRHRVSEERRKRCHGELKTLQALGGLDDFSSVSGHGRVAGFTPFRQPTWMTYPPMNYVPLRIEYDWRRYAEPDFQARSDGDRKALAQIEQRAQTLVATCDSVTNLLSTVARIRDSLDGLRERLNTTLNDERDRAAFSAEMNRLHAVTQGLKSLKLHYVEKMADAFGLRNPLFALAVVDTTKKVYQFDYANILQYEMTGTDLHPYIRNHAKLAMAKNETEGVQIVVLPFWDELRDVTVTATDLVGPDGAVIDAENVEARPVGYVMTKCYTYWGFQFFGGCGWQPDILLDYEPFDVRGCIQPVWVNIHVPADAEAGVYHGRVNVTANGASYAVKLEVEVYDFALPEKITFRNVMHINLGYIDMHHPADHNRLARLAYEKLSLGYKVNPIGLYQTSPAPPMEDLAFCMNHGQNTTTLGGMVGEPFSIAGDNPDDALRKRYYAYAKARGWLENMVYYISDEAGHSAVTQQKIKQKAEYVRTLFPNVKTCGAATLPMGPEADAIDIHVPLFGVFDGAYPLNRKLCQATIAKGAEMWAYQCHDPYRPWPNLGITGHPGIDPRIIPWVFRHEGLSGYLYCYINFQWTENVNTGRLSIRNGPFTPWDTATCNGEGTYLYPGPLGSTRLENFRDGMEDFEYFAILERLIAQKQDKLDESELAKAKSLLKVPGLIVPADVFLHPHKNNFRYTTNVQDLYSRREQMARMIEELQAVE